MHYPERIYLVGYMGSGKTTTGRQLAALLNYHFIDLDKLIETTYKTSIPLLFKKYDEHAFRLIEQKMLQETKTYSQTIISTGGGAPCFFDNMDFINQWGISIYLKLSTEALFERLIKAQKNRPLIKNVEEHDLHDHIQKTLKERELYYLKAHIVINALNTGPEEILKALENHD